MPYAIEGHYFEVCNCKVNWRCIFEGGDYDGDVCDASSSGGLANLASAVATFTIP